MGIEKGTGIETVVVTGSVVDDVGVRTTTVGGEV